MSKQHAVREDVKLRIAEVRDDVMKEPTLSIGDKKEVRFLPDTLLAAFSSLSSATHSTALHCTALHCTALHHTAPRSFCLKSLSVPVLANVGCCYENSVRLSVRSFIGIWVLDLCVCTVLLTFVVTPNSAALHQLCCAVPHRVALRFAVM